MTNEEKCPFQHGAAGGASKRDWWPNQLKVDLLHRHSSKSNPMGGHFNYAEEFRGLGLGGCKKDLAALMTDSRPGWPADFGHCGPVYVMAWRSTGTADCGMAAAAAGGADGGSRP